MVMSVLNNTFFIPGICWEDTVLKRGRKRMKRGPSGDGGGGGVCWVQRNGRHFF